MGRPRLARPAAFGRNDAGQSRRVGASRPSRRGARRTQSHACDRPQADRRRLSPGWPTGMSEARVERRLAAILAVDVAGYSRLMGADEEGTLAALRAVRRELGDP